jgi:hypothetical protein
MHVMSYHSIELLKVAFRGRNAARIDAQTPGVLAVDTLTAIVMSCASAEAFINEIVEHVRVYQQARDQSLRDGVTSPMVALADTLEAIEQDHGSVLLKYQVAALTLGGKAFPKGEAPFQDFAQLVKLRNAILHLRPTWSSESHPGEKVVSSLEQRRLTLPNDRDATMSWFNKLESPGVATWACKSAHEIMLAILAYTPDPPEGQTHDPRPFRGFKDQLRSAAFFGE